MGGLNRIHVQKQNHSEKYRKICAKNVFLWKAQVSALFAFLNFTEIRILGFRKIVETVAFLYNSLFSSIEACASLLHVASLAVLI